MEKDYLKKILSETLEAQVFCDVGGYHGFYSLVSKAEKNYVFEVDPENLETLKKNVELNPTQDIRIQEKAVWSSNGSVKVETGEGGKSNVSSQGLERESVTLDSFFEDREDPDVVKIDVEGAEGHVLQGAEQVLEKSHPTLFIEFHFDNRLSSFGHSFSELKKFLQDFGYSFEFVQNRGSEKLVVAE